MLVYTCPKRAQYLSTNMKNTRAIDSDIDPAILRRCDDFISGNSHQVLIAVDDILMRGYDFRATATGLVLVVDQSFKSSREVQQALGRVGRYGEPC